MLNERLQLKWVQLYSSIYNNLHILFKESGSISEQLQMNVLNARYSVAPVSERNYSG